MGFRNEHGWRVVASKGGTPENPAWYYNLRANPSFEIEALVDGEIMTVPVTASEIPADEWQDAYRAIVAEEPQFGGYLKKTDRRIPVFQLTPRAGGEPFRFDPQQDHSSPRDWFLAGVNHAAR